MHIPVCGRVLAKHTLGGRDQDTHHKVGNTSGGKAKVERLELALAHVVRIMGFLQCVKLE